MNYTPQIAVYMIKNIITGEFYIGASIDIRRRKSHHFGHLRRNVHINRNLQKAYNEYGKNNFIFEIIKESTRETLTQDEISVIAELRPTYNIAELSEEGRLGTKWSEESRIKYLKYAQNRPESHNKNLRNSLKKNTKFVENCKNTCKILSEKNKVEIEVLNLNDEVIFTFTSIKETAEKLEIDKNSINCRLSGLVKSPLNNLYKFKYKNGRKRKYNKNKIHYY